MKRSAILRVAPTATAAVKLRLRKCAVCKSIFSPRSSFARACSPECAEKIAVVERAKRDRRELSERKEAIKPRSKWLAEAQAAFNAFIRARDAVLPCISCGRFHTGAYDAGHYRSVGAAPELRFHEDNCHKQCVPCNQHKGGNVLEYRLGLIKRIGADLVDWLEGPHQAAKFSIDDAKNIKATYKAKLKELQVNK